MIIDIFEQLGHTILGLIDDFREAGATTMGYQVIGKREDLPRLAGENPESKFFIAVGDNWIRQQIKNDLLQRVPEAQFANAIHPTATLGRQVRIGTGVAIMGGVVVNSNSAIEDFTIINTGARVDHDTTLGKFSSIAPGAVMGGNVSLGNASVVAIGAVVSNNVTIGEHTVIGAAALQLTNAGDRELWYGIPARKIRDRDIGERYL